jgi:hypothetical protein
VSWRHPSFLNEKMDQAKGKQGNIRRIITLIKLKQHTFLCAHKMLGIYFPLKKASFSPHIFYTHVYNIFSSKKEQKYVFECNNQFFFVLMEIYLTHVWLWTISEVVESICKESILQKSCKNTQEFLAWGIN